MEFHLTSGNKKKSLYLLKLQINKVSRFEIRDIEIDAFERMESDCGSQSIEKGRFKFDLSIKILETRAGVKSLVYMQNIHFSVYTNE